MLHIDHYVSESSQMFNEFVVFRIGFTVVTYVQVLCSHVTHATKTDRTKTHRQHAKVTLDAAFVIGVVTTADRAGVGI
jgi:exopolysaccharide biosynthesis protein